MTLSRTSSAPARASLLCCALAGALSLAACGGGGDDPPSAEPLPPASTLAKRCVAPRDAATVNEDGQPYRDVQGTADDEKAWVRSWIDETYLWYPDVRALDAGTLDAARYPSAAAFFAALKSPLKTSTGTQKDRFHFTEKTSDWVAEARAGKTFGYGFQIALISKAVPRKAVVAYTDPDTAAGDAGIARGAEIVAVDGVDVVNAPSQADADKISAALFPATAGAHTFTLRDPGAAATRQLTLVAGVQPTTPVQNVKTLPAPNDKVGYLLFNSHLATSEPQLIAAVDQLKTAGVTDLVLDIRYNGGGYLDIASELAYMIAGPAATRGKVFEKVLFNDRNPFGLSDDGAKTPFHTSARGLTPQSPAGRALPTLGLSRVYVLTGANTCSASESVINGLRGVGVKVHQIGATTCGKPYGFFPTDNCGTTYFAIQFRGVNDAGFGDYADGFTPACPVVDDVAHALGDPAEARLAVALGHMKTGTCTPAAAAGRATIQSSSIGAVDRGEPQLMRSRALENRLYLAAPAP